MSADRDKLILQSLRSKERELDAALERVQDLEHEREILSDNSLATLEHLGKQIERLRAENTELKLALADRSEKYKLFMDSGLEDKCREVEVLKKQLSDARLYTIDLEKSLKSKLEKCADALKKISGHELEQIAGMYEMIAEKCLEDIGEIK